MDATTGLKISASEESAIAPSVTKAKKPLLMLAIVLLFVVGAVSVWQYNLVVADRPLQRVLTQDPRNVGIRADAKFEGWFDVNTLVFDIDSVSKASRLDVLRTFLEYSDAMKNHRVKKVILACQGTPKFQMEGTYFQRLGMEYSTQNPMYTIRTLPINVSAMDGSHPYVEYEGGLLGVLSKELEQFGDFSDRWYGKQLTLASGSQK